MCLKFCIRFTLYQTTLQLGMKNSSHPSTASRLLFMTCSLFRYYDPPLQYCSRNSTPIQFRISSNMCIRGSCGKFGRCYQFFSGGNMFSTCTCFAGKKTFKDNINILRRCYLASCNLISQSLKFTQKVSFCELQIMCYN